MNIYVIGGAVITTFLSGWMVNGWRYEARIGKINADNAIAVAQAVQEVGKEAQVLQEKKDDALKKATARAQQNATAANAARSELDGLRQQLDKATGALPANTCEAATNYARTLETIFRSCARDLEQLAIKADGHRLDAETLSNAWPKVAN